MRNDVTVHRVVKTEKRRGEQIPLHRHSFFHYIFCLSGHTVVTIGSEIVTAEPRTLLLIPPDTDHSIVSLDISHSLDVKFSCSEELRREITLLPAVIRKPGEYECDLLRYIFEEAVEQNTDYDEIIALRLYELLILLRRSTEGKSGVGMSGRFPTLTDTAEPIHRALSYIEANLRSPIHITVLAAECGYNVNYFQALFKEHTGENPRRYINRRRIALAKELMMVSPMTVTEISEYLGFQSIHYFSRLFRQLCGQTPSEYMRRVNADRPINVLRNENTPAGEYEIPLLPADGSETL